MTDRSAQERFIVEDTNGGAAAPATKKKKPNSPKAPGMSLRAAMSEAQKVYQQYSHANFSRGELANALGMSSGSGAFWGKSATLIMYGLIEDVGGNMKVSPLFKAIYQASEGSPEMRRNALAAVGKPAVFANLLKQFGTRILDEAAIALRLEMQGGFNRDRAQEVASAFRSSLSDYGLIDGSGNLLPVRETPAPVVAADDGDDEMAEAAAPSSKAASVPSGPGSFRVEVPLANGRKAILALPEDITEADTNKISAVLKAYATN
jgi:hypothetical protein